MEKKKVRIMIIIVFLLGILTILPILLPISITDDTYEIWNGRDLAEGVIGDESYYNTTYYNFTQPNNLSAYDVRADSYEAQIALTTLQGLVNRDNVSLYLIYRDSDDFWLQQLNQTHGINYTMLTPPTYWDVITTFNNSIDGLIIYDEDLLDTVNVATFLAGLYNCVVVHEDQLANFSAMGMNNIMFDFRNDFSTRYDLYLWAWNTYGQFATDKLVCSLDPERTFFRDYVVATKAFSFFLAGGPFGPQHEINLFNRIISSYPQNTPVFGWFTDPGGALGEYESVKLVSNAGQYCLCAAIPDLTVFSSIQPGTINQTNVAFDASSYPIENKVYVSVIVSDGDNVNFCANTLQEYWQDPNRGTVPVGITLEPAMFKIFPTNLKYYYQTATSNEYFLAGPSGAGYCYVDMNPAFPKYLNQSKYAMDQADMDQVWLLNGYEGYQLQYSTEVVKAYTSENCNFSGVYLNYHEFPAELNYLSNDVPVFQSVFVERENELVGKLQALRLANPYTPIFVFVGFWAWDFSFTKLKGAATQLGNDFVFLRPDHFSELYMETQVSTAVRESNEMFMFILAGLIPIISISIALASIWLFYNKKKEPRFEDKKEAIKIFSNKAMFLVIDLAFLLIMRMCFYSTILHLINFLFLILSVAGGMLIKRYIDKLIGVKMSLVYSLLMFMGGAWFFLYRPVLVIFVGFAMGMLLNHQIMSSSNLYSSENSNQRDFVYLIVIAASVVLLFPPEYYHILLISVVIAASILPFICLYFLGKDIEVKKNEIFQLDDINRWYPKGILMGLLFMLLFNPTFSSENLFYHFLWGPNLFPTRLTISFTVATMYIGAILLLEIMRKKEIKLSRKNTIILAVSALLSYIIIPLILSGMFIFILTTFFFIFGMVYCICHLFDDFSSKKFKDSEEKIEYYCKSVSGFANQTAFWLMLGLFLSFIPAAIIINDAQEIFFSIGMDLIGQINWHPIIWTSFHIPALKMLMMVPTTIGVLVFGLFSFLI